MKSLKEINMVSDKTTEIATMIQAQIADLEKMVYEVDMDRDFETYFARIKRWKARTANLLEEKVNRNEKEGFENTGLRSWNLYDQLENIKNEEKLYKAFLKSLKEEIIKYPDNYLSTVIPIKEKTVITKAPKSTSTKTVFVVHGRDEKLRESMFNFLRALGLNPLEWNQAIQTTKKSSPYIGEILDTAFVKAQAIIILFGGDDEARLRKEFWGENEPIYEKDLTPQPRPNVIFEAGMAVGRNEDRTILVQVGGIRPISDIAGRHITHLDNTPQKRQELVTKLRGAGCEVDTNGTDWLSVGDFNSISKTPDINIQGSGNLPFQIL